MTNLRFAIYLALALGVGLALREYARALVADRLGDVTPRRYGWLTLDPRPKLDPFGSLILPLLILVPWATGVWFVPPFAYAKQMPLEPHQLRRGERDVPKVALAGPIANLALAAAAGLAVRAGLGGEVSLVALAFVYAGATMFVFDLMPVPGLSGARLLAPALPPRARAAYVNAGHYLPLFMLVIYFLLAGPLLGVVQGLSNVVCRAVAGSDCIA